MDQDENGSIEPLRVELESQFQDDVIDGVFETIKISFNSHKIPDLCEEQTQIENELLELIDEAQKCQNFNKYLQDLFSWGCSQLTHSFDEQLEDATYQLNLEE